LRYSTEALNLTNRQSSIAMTLQPPAQGFKNDLAIFLQVFVGREKIDGGPGSINALSET
jgi:hypothetical protein